MTKKDTVRFSYGKNVLVVIHYLQLRNGKRKLCEEIGMETPAKMPNLPELTRKQPGI
jgi:hypothetical protein